MVSGLLRGEQQKKNEICFHDEARTNIRTDGHAQEAGS